MPHRMSAKKPPALDPQCVARSVREGQGLARVLWGSRAQGKTAVLARLHEEFEGDSTRVLRATGSRDESEQPYGLLQQLLGQVASCRFPDPLRVVLESPERAEFAQVSQHGWQLFRELASERPTLLLIDDVHGADADSARVLGYVARRVLGHELGVVLTATMGEPIHEELAGLPAAELSGIDESGVRALLGARGPNTAEHVRTELVQLCGGNPLIARECVDSLRTEQLSGRSPLPCEPALGTRSLRVFGAVWSGFGEATRRWLLVLALGPRTSAICVRAGKFLDLSLDDLAPAERAGVVRIRGDSGIHWQSPWVRSSVVQSATLAESTRACAALAEVTPDDRYPVEHARYLAGALVDPDQAASALARATVPMARAGMLLEAHEVVTRAGALTTDTTERERYRIVAAELAWLAGYSDHALDLLDQPELGYRSADARTSALIVRTVIHGFKDSWSTGWQLLPLDPSYEPGSQEHALRLLVTALTAGWESASRESLQQTVARLRDLVDPGGGLVPGVVRTLERVVAGDGNLSDRERESLRTLAWWAQPSDALHPKAWPPRLLPVFLGDEDAYARIFSELLRTEHVQAARSTHAVLLLKLATAQSAMGQWKRAVGNAEQGAELAGELGHHALHAELLLVLAWVAAARGEERACSRHLDAAATYEGNSAGQPMVAQWIRGILALSTGRPSEAFERLRELHHGPIVTPHYLVLRRLSTMDTVEAAVRADRRAEAGELVAEFAGWIQEGAAGWASADLARCRALLDEEDAERWHVLALERSGAAGRKWSKARAELQFGSWLRRRKRHYDARAHLRIAEEEFDRLGAASWRERAHGELRATGETQLDRSGSLIELTPQELHIAELAATGHTNRQIANKLSLSPRTVGYHLYKVFPKLDITSRAQLAAALAEELDE